MNYVGSVSILDRGDAPAQAVIDRNARSLAQRAADETRDELEKVLTRVDNIYGTFEMSRENQMDGRAGAMEYFNDISELEEIMKDHVKKKKYQQQVTIFIVGYQDVCGQKLKLMQQVNEFFMENAKTFEEEESFPTTPEVDLEEASTNIQESLTYANDLTLRLGDLNREIIDYLQAYAEKKANSKGKKKVEKALQQAREELVALQEKLLSAQTEMQEKEEKVDLLIKQLELKNQEAVKYKTAAEVAKKNAQDAEALGEVIKEKDLKIQELRFQLSRLEIDLSQAKNSRERSTNRLSMATEESQAKINQLQKQVDESRETLEDAKRELTRMHTQQITAMHESHQQELEELRGKHQEELDQLSSEMTEAKEQLIQARHLAAQLQLEQQTLKSEANSQDVARQIDLDTDTTVTPDVSSHTSRQESRLSKDGSKSRGTAASKGKKLQPPSRSDTKSSRGNGSRTETAEISVQDEGGDPMAALVEEVKRTPMPSTRQSRRSKSTLEPVREADVLDFDDAFDLADDSAWRSVPADQVVGRFAQYRKLSQQKMAELQEQLSLTVAKTQRKVATLKAQFQEHKSKWDAERKVLVEQVKQAHSLQSEAEKEADTAMSQLEDFILEQERLEQEEEAKRAEISEGSSLSLREDPPAPPPARTTPPPTVPPIAAEASEQELQQLLMQQTDDAKVQEMNARLSISGAVSAPPSVREDTPEDQRQSAKGADADKVRVTGSTDDEIRASSARSRASLREQFRSKLEETRSAVGERRARSPAVSLPDPRDDKELFEDEDEDFPIPDDMKELKGDRTVSHIATSPPPGPEDGLHASPQVQYVVRPSPPLKDHPVVSEFVQAYNGVVSYKERMRQLLLDKDMMSNSEVINEIETIRFDSDEEVLPQIHSMTQNIFYVLDEIFVVLNSILINDREPAVSSLMFVSRDPTRIFTREASLESQPPQPPVPANTLTNVLRSDSMTLTNAGLRGDMAGLRDSKAASQRSSAASQHADKMPTAEKVFVRELQEQYERLQTQHEVDAKKYEEQLRHNTVVMMEMQDTINDLQRELSSLGKVTRKGRSGSGLSSQPGQGSQLSQPGSPEVPVMFTRLDSERNARIMKKAVLEQRLDAEKYKAAVSQMDDYVSLPAQRLAHLVKKYIHHCRMRDIEDKVKQSETLDDEEFEVLDRMEALQNQRARDWADRMDAMGLERMRLANQLMDTLDTVEQESGIFLIKPMYSYRGRDVRERAPNKLTRPLRPQRSSHGREGSALMPLPTPAHNLRPLAAVAKSEPALPRTELTLSRGPVTSDLSGVAGSGLQAWVGSQSRNTWNMSSSQTGSTRPDLNLYNTPRILELDINRMLIGQNNISSRLMQPLSEDRLVNASNNHMRTYVSVQRPVQTPGKAPSPDRPRSATGGADLPSGGVTPRASSANARSKMSSSMSDPDRTIPPSIPSTPPLPPITPTNRVSAS